MSAPRFPSPAPRSIDAISPSLANELHSCETRAAFRKDERFSGWRRPSTFTTLGDVAHALTEAAFKAADWPDDGDAIGAALSTRWNDEMKRGEARLAAVWSPAEPPPAEEWPGYQLTKVRTLRRAHRVVASRGTPAVRTAGTGTELALSDPNSILFGRVDRVESDGGRVRVVDLKTGLAQGPVTPEQRRQLLLYAVLVHRTSGQWPDEIALEDASGSRHAMPLEPAEAEQALADVLSEVANFNLRALRAGASFDANPSADTCRWCPYRVVCHQYWQSLSSDWNHRSVLGRVRLTGTSAAGGFVELSVESPDDLAGSTMRISLLPELPSADVEWVAALDLDWRTNQNEVRARWSSRIKLL